jgi:ribonuclease P/MRP protein subunit RPP1
LDLVREGKRLGYRIIAAEGLNGATVIEGVKMLGKIVFEVSGIEEARRLLAGLKKPGVLVGVVPLTVETARWIAHDRRVDTIVMTSKNMSVFDKKQASVMKYYGKPLEVAFTEISKSSEEIVGQFARKLRLLLGKNIPVIVSSGAREILEYQHPMVVSSYLAKLLSLDLKTAMSLISLNPYRVVSKLGV